MGIYDTNLDGIPPYGENRKEHLDAPVGAPGVRKLRAKRKAQRQTRKKQRERGR